MRELADTGIQFMLKSGADFIGMLCIMIMAYLCWQLVCLVFKAIQAVIKKLFYRKEQNEEV